MPWPRNAPDPLEEKRRQLAARERLVSEQMSRLNRELHHAGDSPGPEQKRTEPPVWRMEEDGTPHRIFEPLPARKRDLARQRQRDMVLFFVCVGLLLVTLVIFIWIFYVHYAAANNGA